MYDKLATTFLAGGQLQHLRVKKADEKPCARDTERRFTATDLDLLQVQAVALDERLDTGNIGVLDEELVDTHEQRGVDVRQPTHEPVGGIR